MADRAKLRSLLRAHPDWSIAQLVTATGRSRYWVQTWVKRLDEASLDDDAILRSRSRRRKHLPEALHPHIEQAILDLRDHPPAGLNRVPGAPTILYYLHQDEALQQAGFRMPTSTSTIWKVLDRNQRILRRQRGGHDPIERPAPMQEWEVDFTDVPTVTPDPNGKRQHVVETLNIVDRGTSILVDSLPHDDYHAETALVALTDAFHKQGLPQRIRLDRDSRFVGSWSMDEFPSALMRHLLCLDIEVDICPPHRPDLKPFVERFNRTLEYECLRVEKPSTLAETIPILEHYKSFYNQQRPHQGRSCRNRPPLVAFPHLPTLPPLPRLIDPDRWLLKFHGRRFRRRVAARGTVDVDKYSYYVGRHLKGHYLVLKLDAHQKQFVIEVDGKAVKSIPIKGLYHNPMLFDDYMEQIRKDARSEWRRWQQTIRQRQRKTTVAKVLGSAR